jgi:hypothetical protein
MHAAGQSSVSNYWLDTRLWARACGWMVASSANNAELAFLSECHIVNMWWFVLKPLRLWGVSICMLDVIWYHKGQVGPQRTNELGSSPSHLPSAVQFLHSTTIPPRMCAIFAAEIMRILIYLTWVFPCFDMMDNPLMVIPLLWTWVDSKGKHTGYVRP